MFTSSILVGYNAHKIAPDLRHPADTSVALVNSYSRPILRQQQDPVNHSHLFLCGMIGLVQFSKAVNQSLSAKFSSSSQSPCPSLVIIINQALFIAPD